MVAKLLFSLAILLLGTLAQVDQIPAGTTFNVNNTVGNSSVTEKFILTFGPRGFMDIMITDLAPAENGTLKKSVFSLVVRSIIEFQEISGDFEFDSSDQVVQIFENPTFWNPWTGPTPVNDTHTRFSSFTNDSNFGALGFVEDNTTILENPTTFMFSKIDFTPFYQENNSMIALRLELRFLETLVVNGKEIPQQSTLSPTEIFSRFGNLSLQMVTDNGTTVGVIASEFEPFPFFQEITALNYTLKQQIFLTINSTDHSLIFNNLTLLVPSAPLKQPTNETFQTIPPQEETPSSTPLELKAVLNGAQEGLNVTGTGQGNFTLDSQNGSLCYNVSFSGLTGPLTVAHFHGPATPGVNAPILIPIPVGQSPLSGCVQVDTEQELQIQKGLWYINLHTAQFPNGEIRGQVTLVDIDATLSPPLE